jgi:hypothetical protein
MALYQIEGCKHLQHANQSCMSDPEYYPMFYENLEIFKKLIIDSVKNSSNLTFLHFGDGDYYFLKCIPVGSATPGKRALSVPYNQIDIQRFRDGLKLNDYVCVEVFEHGNVMKFKELYDIPTPFPTEYLYGLTANKWFTSTFSDCIGLIGADVKLDMIKELMTRKEYQNYLGLESFTDYIKLPQKFACDNLDNTIEIVSRQLKNANEKTKIYLCGMGHVKSGLLHELKKIRGAVYVDIGSGIDALAGIIDPERPYMYDWINYKIMNTSYNADLLQFDQKSNIKVID